MRRKIYRELVLIRTELQSIRGILEQKPILEKNSIYDTVMREQNNAKVRRDSGKEVTICRNN